VSDVDGGHRERTIGGDSSAHGVQGETRCRPGNRAPLRRWLPALAAAALPWAGPGCGKNETNGFVPVAGRVMLDSKPLPVGSVSFRPDASKGNTSMHIPNGDIDAEGNYELVTLGREGAPPGWYKVLVFADANTLATAGAPPVHPLPPKWMMNVKYTSEKTTNLSIKVVDKAAPGAYDLNVSK
jgi:hypothetical protein